MYMYINVFILIHVLGLLMNVLVTEHSKYKYK
jgi:hypothetical protein